MHCVSGTYCSRLKGGCLQPFLCVGDGALTSQSGLELLLLLLVAGLWRADTCSLLSHHSLETLDTQHPPASSSGDLTSLRIPDASLEETQYLEGSQEGSGSPEIDESKGSYCCPNWIVYFFFFPSSWQVSMYTVVSLRSDLAGELDAIASRLAFIWLSLLLFWVTMSLSTYAHITHIDPSWWEKCDHLLAAFFPPSSFIMSPYMHSYI